MRTSKALYHPSFILFLISPLFNLVASFKTQNIKYIRNAIWLFYVFYGYVIVGSIEGTDVSRFFSWFAEFATLDLEAKVSFLSNDARLDYFKSATFYLVSLFSASPRVYFAFIGLVFGYFYSGIIVNLYRAVKIDSFFSAILLIHFIFIIPFYSLQFVRFSTAVVIFLHFVFEFYLNGKKPKYLILSGLSILVHFSFILPFTALIIFNFLPKNLFFYFSFYLITTVFIQPQFSTVKKIIESNVPTIILEEKQTYLNEDYAEDVKVKSEETNWYIKYRGILKKYATLILVITIIFKKRYLDILNKDGIILFAFGLFLMSISNIVAVIPSGSRFLNVANPIIWFVLIVFITNDFYFKKLLFLKSLLFLFLVFQIIVGLRYAFDSVSIDLLFSNPILSLIYVAGIPLIDFFK